MGVWEVGGRIKARESKAGGGSKSEKKKKKGKGMKNGPFRQEKKGRCDGRQDEW